MKFKPLEKQVVVLTGATSGIGLVTARMAAKRGAKLVLVARDEASLQKLSEEIKDAGGQAMYVVADVSDEKQVREISRQAVSHFGGFDTWINDAGLAIFGLMRDVPTEDHRRLFDINFWGLVYGSLEAARHFRERGARAEYSGVIINLGSTVSDRAIPIQGMYATSKHAVKGFTDALRMELGHEGVPVALSLIKPSAIATPFAEHARNYMQEEPTLPPPLYAPEVVAKAILKCAQAPQRDVFCGGGGKMLSTLGQYFPGLGDKILGEGIIKQQKKNEPASHRPDSLYKPGFGLKERGDFPDRHVSEHSSYSRIIQSPILKALLVVGAGLALLNALGAKRR